MPQLYRCKKNRQTGYELQANIEIDDQAVARKIKQSGRFIRATNVLDIKI